MKRLYFIVLLLLSSLAYGQKSVLLQNVNNRAKELQHQLNKTEDSIIFKSERTIYEIMIFNDDFERIIKVKDNNAKILISDIPVGRYAVEAVLIDKLIVITLLRNESFNLQEPTPLLTAIASPYNEEINPPQIVSAIKKESYGSENNTGRTDLSLYGKTAPSIVKEKKSLTLNKGFTSKTVIQRQAEVENTTNSTYWVIHKINNGSSSEKILKIVDQKTVDRMIRKNEIDMKTFSGRLNELSVWKIHDTTRFVQHKRRNKANYMNVESDSFNLIPYYETNHNLDNN